MKKDKISLVLTIFLILGLGLLLYPSLADYWNASRSTRIVNQYSQDLAQLSARKLEDLLDQARAYNDRLASRPFSTEMTEEELADYYSQLKIPSSDIMATVEIPSINVNLPIYHGTGEGVLQSALGHIEWTSLPVGGEGSHATITGHRGLISARLFTDIDQLVPGDLFFIQVLGEKLSYQVDQIKIVLPHESQDLARVDGQDYMTLLTCTPYGINTHRLLVRGHRVANEDLVLYLTAEAFRIKPLYVALVLMVPLGLAFSLVLFYLDQRKRKKRKIRKEWEENEKNQ